MLFKPVAVAARFHGILVCAWIVLIDYLFLMWALRRAGGAIQAFFLGLIVLSLPLLAYVGYRTWSAFSLRYTIDPDAIRIRWATRHRTIRLDAMQRVVLEGVESDLRGRIRNWPASFLYRVRGADGQSIHLTATLPVSRCLIVETENERFALSPADRDAFLDAVREFHEGKRTVDSALAARRSLHAFLGGGWQGPALLGLGLLLTFLLAAIFMVSFPDLRGQSLLAAGLESDAQAMRSVTGVSLLPLLGAAAWLVNGLLGMLMASRGQRTGAYMLWGGAIVVQLASLSALLSLIR